MDIQQKDKESLAAYIHMIQKGSQEVQLHQQCSHNKDICKRS